MRRQALVPRADVLLAAATTAGLILYGLSRLFHDAFYRQLSTSVDEVGLDQATMLGSAVVSSVRTFSSLRLLFATAVAAAIVSAVWAARSGSRHVWEHLMTRSAVAIVAVTILTILRLAFPSDNWTTLALLTIIWVWVLGGDAIRSLAVNRFGLREVLVWTLLLVTLAGAPLVAVSMGTRIGKEVAGGAISSQAERLLAQPPYDVGIYDPEKALSTIGVGRDSDFAIRCGWDANARATTDDQRRQLEISRDDEQFVMLGQSQGTMVVWNVERRMALRLSGDQFAFASCGDPPSSAAG